MPGAIVVPPAAVQRGSSGPFVYVVTEERSVERRLVKLGPLDGADQSVESGVSAGDLLVVSGADRLREGSKVLVSEGSEAGKAGREPGKGRGPSAAPSGAEPKTARGG